MVDILTIARAYQTYETMSPKKLQKLCYYTYAWDKALEINKIENTRFEAWVHGPVSPLIYYRYREDGPYQISKIDCRVEDIIDDGEVYELISQIWRIYGEFNGEQLEDFTHSERPWIEARAGLPEWTISNNLIDESLMKTYYSRLLDDAGQ